MKYEPFADDETEGTQFVKFWKFAAWKTLRQEHFSAAEVERVTGLPFKISQTFCSSKEFCTWHTTEGPDKPATYLLRADPLLGCLEYVELHEARESAKQAKQLALAAIGVSIGLGLISLLVGVLQILVTVFK